MGSMITSFSGQYAFLSNFWKVQIPLAGLVYPTVEHAYVAMKSEDKVFRAHVANNVPSPGAAKWLGRRIRKLRPNWDSLRVEIMAHLISLKFREENTDLRKALLNTRPAILVEGNTWGDRYWGAVDAGGSWQGENHLGIILMRVRESIENGNL